ncbi:hypothetical protein DD592_26925, partial [Enterobacter cloacae complex sp. 2DZ2F20B]
NLQFPQFIARISSTLNTYLRVASNNLVRVYSVTMPKAMTYSKEKQARWIVNISLPRRPRSLYMSSLLIILMAFRLKKIIFPRRVFYNFVFPSLVNDFAG